jgi:hypothetical protein
MDITKDELEKIRNFIRQNFKSSSDNNVQSNGGGQRPLSISVPSSSSQASIIADSLTSPPTNTSGMPAICHVKSEIKDATLKLDISQAYAGLGHAICAGDFNGDGYKDLGEYFFSAIRV